MDIKETILSNYIDSLNKERKPSEHDGEMHLEKMEELIETTRLVRSLKGPIISDKKYAQKLTENLKKRFMKEKEARKVQRGWFFGAAAALIITLNTAAPFGKTNMVYAMEQAIGKPQVEVPVNIKVEEGDQKNADAGHSPWKLDSVFVAQVFVSLKLSPGGIKGDYPIKYEELKLIKNTGKEAVVEVGGNKTPINKVYLKRLVRQDNTGIWTVVGYDPISSK